MENYSDKFTKIFKDMHSEGFWFQNKNVKIGFSFIYVYIDEDDNVLINVDCDEDNIETWGIYNNWEDFFSHHPDLRIALELDEGLDSKFYSWNELKDMWTLKDRTLKEQFYIMKGDNNAINNFYTR